MIKFTKKNSTLGNPEENIESSSNINKNENVLRDRRISNRSIQIGTRVTPEFKALIDKICYEDKLLLVELLEIAINDYEKKRNRR